MLFSALKINVFALLLVWLEQIDLTSEVKVSCLRFVLTTVRMVTVRDARVCTVRKAVKRSTRLSDCRW